MGKLAFIFPGQGSQAAGMGKALADAFPSARRVFDEIDAALGDPKLSRLCFEGPDEQLKLTANTQPAILAVSAAVVAVLAEHGVSPTSSPAIRSASTRRSSRPVRSGRPRRRGPSARAAPSCRRRCRPGRAPWRPCSGWSRGG